MHWYLECLCWHRYLLVRCYAASVIPYWWVPRNHVRSRKLERDWRGVLNKSFGLLGIFSKSSLLSKLEHILLGEAIAILYGNLCHSPPVIPVNAEPQSRRSLLSSGPHHRWRNYPLGLSAPGLDLEPLPSVH